MKTLAILFIAASLFAAEPTPPPAAKTPTISDQDKLKIRELQVQALRLLQQRLIMEKEYAETPTGKAYTALKEAQDKAQAEFDALIKKVTPEGFVLQDDLALVIKPSQTAQK